MGYIHETQVSHERSVHPMLELLFYSSMTCTDADALMLSIKMNRAELPKEIVVELVETVKESVPECRYYWDAND